jgi:hypothetical protein
MRGGAVSLLFGLLVLAGSTPAADWPQFRGPNMAGMAAEAKLPDHWGPTENLAWKVPLPGRGVSSPVVVGDRVFITASSGLNQTRLHLMCFAAGRGEKLWERQFWATGPTNCHPKTSMAGPTPVVDGDRLFALFATGDLVCTDLAGNVRWLRTLQVDYPLMANFVGRAGSPIVHGGTLVVPLESQGASFLLGIDAATGRNRWRVERPRENCFTTPLLVRHGNMTDLVVQALGGLAGYDPDSGTRRWEFPDEGTMMVASPAAADGLVLGVGREMVALKLTDASPPEVAWRSARLGTITPTPLVADGRVYSLKDGGTIVCGDLKTGKEVWTQRLRGTFSASPILVDGKLYLINEDGETTVLRAGDKPERVVTNPLAGPMLATPAVGRGCLFMRTDEWLYRIGK